MTIDQKQLDRAVKQLNRLSKVEYRADLESVLSDVSRPPSERLLRIGRMLGVKVKEPFAMSARTARSHRTGALRSWELRPERFHQSKPQNTWQFKLLAALIREPELRRQEYLGPEVESVAAQIANESQYRSPSELASLLASWFGIQPNVASAEADILLAGTPSDLDSVDWVQARLEDDLRPYRVENVAVEMMHERGFFRCMAFSVNGHLGEKPQLLRALQPTSSGVFGRPSLIGPRGVERANALRADVEWMRVADPIIVAGFLILIDSMGVDGFTTWVSTDLQSGGADEV